MMIDSKSYRMKFEDASLDELVTERDRIIKFMHDYENHRLPLGDYLMDPSPEVRYSMKIRYLMEICDLIQIRMEKEDFHQKSPQILIYRDIDEYLSGLDEAKQKEGLEKLKKDDKKLYDEFIEWKNSEQ